MPLSRRSFLRAGTLTAFAATAALGPRLTAFGRSLGPAGPASASGLTRAAFESYVGGVFHGCDGRREVNLTLLQVEGYQPDPATSITQSRSRATDTFTLTFGADAPLGTLSATHTLEHGAFGSFDLFMTGGADGRGRYVYHAVINRLV